MATKNPYRIPKQFPNIIKYINRLSPKGVSPTAQCRIVTNDDRLHLIETKSGNLHLLGECRYYTLNGVLAGRFCTTIYSFVGLLTKLKPSITKEVEEFLVWLKNVEEKDENELKYIELEAKASELGFQLIPKG